MCILIAVLLNAQVFSQDSKTELSLLEAIRHNSIKQVKSLLEKGANANAVDDDSDNMLINAAIYSTADCMQLLLKKGADPNARNSLGETSLMFSVPDMEKTKLLLNNGADLNIKAISGNTALMVAVVGNRQYAITKFLLEKEMG